jgi:hypothetical protein
MSPVSQTRDHIPLERPVNGAFQWVALLTVALTLITAIKLLW